MGFRRISAVQAEIPHREPCNPPVPGEKKTNMKNVQNMLHGPSVGNYGEEINGNLTKESRVMEMTTDNSSLALQFNDTGPPGYN